jgi:ArsR family transcriptional regulator, arsenate/arsenite/antimonite-responsive transcriptional repressor
MSVKSGCSDEAIAEYSKKLKVCGHPVRLQLLVLIEKNEEPCVTDLWTCVNESQPVVSQHLAVLKESKIVQSDVEGNKRRYSIVDPFVKQIVASVIAKAK